MIKSNFSFLEGRFPEHYILAVEAEQNMIVKPRTAVMYARLTLEELIRWMYTYDFALSGDLPEKQTLEGLMYHEPFKLLIASVPGMIDGLTLIRKNGNQALHNKNEVALRYAHSSINSLYEFAKWIYYIYVDSSVLIPFSLDNSLIPKGDGSSENLSMIKALFDRLEEKKSQFSILNLQFNESLQQKDSELEKLQAEISRIKKENQNKPVETFTLNPTTEAETRRTLIDVLLREAGWQLNNPEDTEFEVSGMPNKTGLGYVDYVLWGDNGLPLAVVEAKNALLDPRQGQHQAKLYADCMQNRFGRRPVIFYSNGYDTWIWNDCLYPPRKISGFYSKDELEWTISKHANKPLSNVQINRDIAGRYYQEQALKRVAATFDAKFRKALLVMATGSGKTRTAVALAEMMMKQGWARRILFLADRNALVIQAKRAFTNLSPNLSSADITMEKENINIHRMIFSTYQTIINKIDSEKINETPVYSPGHFDLIIIDEAHRSIYRKYQAIFHYFDALLLGLTATPKSDIDRNTYDFFDLENHNPTYAYELDEAVFNQFLVPFKKVEASTKFMRRGIKYNELSDGEKEEYEEKFYDESAHTLPDEIDSSELNQFVFNEDTIDRVLNQLMTEGQKIEGGDKIGKTIIFAKNHNHAVFIQERFNKLFPCLGGDFIQVIDNYQVYAQNQIDDFGNSKKHPQIAVSIDMLDTGIDIPEIVNLVFFKAVRSAVKFWQMIGRGTRLCPGIFGIPQDENDKSMDKKYFLVFDYCGNFEFFGVNPDGFEVKLPKSLAQQIMEARIRVALAIGKKELDDKDHHFLQKGLLDRAHQTVEDLNRNSFVVKAVLREVDKYGDREKWNSLSSEDISTIFDKLTPLAEPDDSDEDARRFDLFMLNFMLSIVEENRNIHGFSMDIKAIAKNLLKKRNLPIVKQKENLLKAMTKDDYWGQSVSAATLEYVRVEIRSLIRLLDNDRRKIVYTAFEDELTISKQVVTDTAYTPYMQAENYIHRVERYIRENENNPVIQKLKKNIPINHSELSELEKILFDGKDRGTKDDFIKRHGQQPLGKFIRSIVGLDINAAKEAFSDFLNAGNLSADQIQFINKIIDYLTRNGIIEADRLFEEPFTNFHTQGITGLFDNANTSKIIAILKRINNNAAA